MEIALQLRIQFEFTLGVLLSNSEEEVQSLKEKLGLKQKSYENVKSKEDLTILPAKYVLVLFHDKLVVELTRILQKCIKKDRSGKVKLMKTHDNIAKVKILVNLFCYFI